MKPNIALFGGSFDPPHSGHLDIINRLVELKFLDLIIIVPAYVNPIKSHTYLSPENRMSMLYNMINPNPKIIISDYEICQGRAVYSIDTIMHFKALYDVDYIYFVIGADVFLNLDTWYRIDDIKRHVRFIIAKRDSYLIKTEDISFDYDVIILDTHDSSSSSQIREKYFAKFKISQDRI